MRNFNLLRGNVRPMSENSTHLYNWEMNIVFVFFFFVKRALITVNKRYDEKQFTCSSCVQSHCSALLYVVRCY